MKIKDMNFCLTFRHFKYYWVLLRLDKLRNSSVRSFWDSAKCATLIRGLVAKTWTIRGTIFVWPNSFQRCQIDRFEPVFSKIHAHLTPFKWWFFGLHSCGSGPLFWVRQRFCEQPDDFQSADLPSKRSFCWQENYFCQNSATSSFPAFASYSDRKRNHHYLLLFLLHSFYSFYIVKTVTDCY